MSEWISVKEQLPEEGTEALVHNGNLGIAWYKQRYRAGTWWDGEGNWTNVTHWMPLPAPPLGARR